MKPPRTDASRRAPRVLVISYLFPPRRAVGALRWGALTKYLARSGWPVHVITAHLGLDPPECVDGRQVHRIHKATTLNDRYRRLVKRRDRESGSLPETVVAADPAPRASDWHLFGLRRAVAATLGYPDHSRGWLLKAALAARRMIAKQDIEIVVSSGPPHSAHVAAMLATYGTRARWVVDLRDPWAEMLERFRGDTAPAFLHRLTRRLERSAFERCDRIVCTTRAYAERLVARGFAKASWVPNGIDAEALPEPCEPEHGPTVLAYVGTLYFNRNLGPVLEAMALCEKSPEVVPKGVKLRFAGRAPAAHASALRRQQAEYGLDDARLERLGPLPRDEARSVLCRAHLGIVLAQAQPMQIPAKLYESVGMGLPTLVLAEPMSAAALEAERLGAIWRDPSDVAGIAGVIRDVANGTIPARVHAPDVIDYRAIATTYSEMLLEVVK